MSIFWAIITGCGLFVIFSFIVWILKHILKAIYWTGIILLGCSIALISAVVNSLKATT